MITLQDYTAPFDAIKDFEKAIASYTGAKYCVTTDCCTHAIEIALRLTHNKSMVAFPAKTYLSIPMLMHKLNIPYELKDQSWRDYYQIEGTKIWDCARYLRTDMYVSGTIQCLSFGRSKPLEIGQGGCLLTDDQYLYEQASRMRYDGRDIFNYSPWSTQKEFTVGYHYYLRPEECIIGLNLLKKQQFTNQIDKYFDYPDCRTITINE